MASKLDLDRANAAQEVGLATSSSPKREFSHAQLWKSIFNDDWQYGRSEQYLNRGCDEIDFVLVGSDLVYLYDDHLERPKRPLCLVFGSIRETKIGQRQLDSHRITNPHYRTVSHCRDHKDLDQGIYIESQNIILQWPATVRSAKFLPFLGKESTAMSLLVHDRDLHRDIYVGFYHHQRQVWYILIWWGPRHCPNCVTLEMQGDVKPFCDLIDGIQRDRELMSGTLGAGRLPLGICESCRKKLAQVAATD